jgi:hypothetical protein
MVSESYATCSGLAAGHLENCECAVNTASRKMAKVNDCFLILFIISKKIKHDKKENIIPRIVHDCRYFIFLVPLIHFGDYECILLYS